MESETIKKLPKLLKEMRLPIMAEEYENQKSDPAVLQLSFDERLYELVSKESDSRINHTIERYIKTAGFYYSSANLEDINYKPERKLDKGLIEELSTNDYLEHGLNIILIGASGCGKTWLSCAFGVNACINKYRAKYIRLPELFSEFRGLIEHILRIFKSMIFLFSMNSFYLQRMNLNVPTFWNLWKADVIRNQLFSAANGHQRDGISV